LALLPGIWLSDDDLARLSLVPLERCALRRTGPNGARGRWCGRLNRAQTRAGASGASGGWDARFWSLDL